jgi:hypothetical protein
MQHSCPPWDFSSLKGVVWVGIALFLFGLATLFYPRFER